MYHNSYGTTSQMTDLQQSITAAAARDGVSIGRLQKVVTVATSTATAFSVTLPQQPIVNKPMTINVGSVAASVALYAATPTGTDNSAVNGQAAGLPLFIPANTSVTAVCTSKSVITAGGNIPSCTWTVMGFSTSTKVRTLPSMTAAGLTLTTADEGVLFVPAATAAGALNIPDAAGNAGLMYELRMTAVAAFAITITPAGGTITGVYHMSAGGAGADVTAQLKTAAADAVIAATAIAGDFIKLISNGTNWQVYAVSGVVAGFT